MAKTLPSKAIIYIFSGGVFFASVFLLWAPLSTFLLALFKFYNFHTLFDPSTNHSNFHSEWFLLRENSSKDLTSLDPCVWSCFFTMLLQVLMGLDKYSDYLNCYGEYLYINCNLRSPQTPSFPKKKIYVFFFVLDCFQEKKGDLELIVHCFYW